MSREPWNRNALVATTTLAAVLLVMQVVAGAAEAPDLRQVEDSDDEWLVEVRNPRFNRVRVGGIE